MSAQTAQIIPFAAVTRVPYIEPQTVASTGEPGRPRLVRGQAIRVHSHDEQLGPACFAALVLKVDGDWVAIDVEGCGRFSVHWTVCEPLEEGEDGDAMPGEAS